MYHLANLIGLSLADEGVRIGRVPVLQHLSHARSARRLQQRLQLIQRFFAGGLLGREAVGVQADQNRPVNDDLFFVHICSPLPRSRRAGL